MMCQSCQSPVSQKWLTVIIRAVAENFPNDSGVFAGCQPVSHIARKFSKTPGLTDRLTGLQNEPKPP